MQGKWFSRAISWARRCFLTVMGKYVPPLTVASLAMIITSVPCTTPRPVTMPAAGAALSYISYAASAESSRNGAPGSSSVSMRSRASSLPRWRCSATARAPPPSWTCWSRSRRRRTCSRLWAMLLLKAALAGLIWDCKTSIRLLSLLLLGDVHTSKCLSVAAADLLTALAGELSDVLSHFLWLGQLTAVTEQRLDFEFNGLRNIDIRVGMPGATEVDLTHLVRWQAGIGLRHVTGIPGGRIDGVKHGQSRGPMVWMKQIKIVERPATRVHTYDNLGPQAAEHIDNLITKRQRRLHPPIWLSKKDHVLDAQNICGEPLLRLTDLGNLRRRQDQAALVIFTAFPTGRQHKVDFFPFPCPHRCCPATCPVQVIGMSPKDCYHLMCHAVSLSSEFQGYLLSLAMGDVTRNHTLNIRARLTAVYIDTGPRHQRGTLRSQEGHHRRYFFGFAKTSQRHLIAHKILDKYGVFLLAPLPRAAWKQDGTRRHYINHNTVFGKLLGKRFGPAIHARFHGIVGHRSTSLASIDRRNVDDTAPATFAHQRNHH